MNFKSKRRGLFNWTINGRSIFDAGFYSDQRGPLPFAFGVVPAEKYYILRFK